MTPTTAVVLASRPNGEPVHENFRLEVRDVGPVREGQALLRTIYLSLDPYMRGRMNAGRSYATPVEIGEVMEGATVCEVLESASPLVTAGDIVLAHTGWQTHTVEDARLLRRIDPSKAPISTALGILGMPAFAAYVGLTEIGRPRPGETLVVAAAAGPVGSMVGQIARLRGARTVGIAGGPKKVTWLKELGFDAAIDHRSATFADDLSAAVPDGVDIYFENVGGAVWDAVFEHLNDFARIPVCGLIAQYNQTGPSAGPDRLPLLMKAVNTKRLLVQGFTQRDFITTHYDQFQRDVSGWLADGKLRYREDFVDGIENAPDAFFGLLQGKNFGKLIVRVSEDPTSAAPGVQRE
ncbi:NADP-dependent oxidoreductase [Mycolicibacterium helvum]|uniref:NADP-dependent oxidoreductase n=1 Tax=Mycolicibacterium helvum TaxID=1534349 RepID=A0A7I7TGE9_9MYCO|nr:NADP-dependent oxidoreductase [Mycolicibacterium helvum]BBY67671.1 NADP-dependent oxidoreductase [Mycolicibacterium helvum]